jgi:hypothetical protein
MSGRLQPGCSCTTNVGSLSFTFLLEIHKNPHSCCQMSVFVVGCVYITEHLCIFTEQTLGNTFAHLVHWRESLSLTRLTRCGLFRPGAGPGNRFRLRQNGRFSILFTKNSQSEFFCEQDQKSTMLPQAKRPSGLAPGRNQRHRVTRVIDRSPWSYCQGCCPNVPAHTGQAFVTFEHSIRTMAEADRSASRPWQGDMYG